MSIGIAVTLPDGALLVTDSRRSWPQAENKCPQDNVDKMVEVSPTIFAIPVGIVQATDWALFYLKSNAQGDCTPHRFSCQMKASVRFGWKQFVGSLAPDVDRAHPTMRAALIAGGLAGRVPFIAAYLCGSGLPPSSALRQEPYKVLLLGGEKQRAHELVVEKAERSLRSVTWDHSTGPINLSTALLLKAVVDVVKYVDAQDVSVGGSIRYVVIREGFPVKKAVWSEGSSRT